MYNTSELINPDNSSCTLTKSVSCQLPQRKEERGSDTSFYYQLLKHLHMTYFLLLHVLHGETTFNNKMEYNLRGLDKYIGVRMVV